MGTNRIRAIAGLTGLTAALVCVAARSSPPVDETAAAAAAAIPAPTAYTGYAGQSSPESELLHGSVGPKGQPASYYFSYGTTPSYGLQTPATAAGNGTNTVNVSVPVGGLAPDTTYHYQLVVTGPGGTALGADRTFTTAKLPLTLSLARVHSPVVYRAPFAIEGTLAGSENIGKVVVLQSDPYPYTSGFGTLAKAVTGPTGKFVIQVAGLSASAQLRVEAPASATAVSPVFEEDVTVSTYVHVRRLRHRRGYGIVWGTIAPSVAGATVAIERRAPGGRYVVAGGAAVLLGHGGGTHFAHLMRMRPGTYRVLVHVPRGALVSARSKPFRVRF